LAFVSGLRLARRAELIAPDAEKTQTGNKPGIHLPAVLALASVAVIGSAAQSATGFGVALPVAPVAFAVLSPADAVLTVAAASLMNNLLVLGTRHRRLAVRGGDGALLVAAAIPTLLIGALVVSHVSKPPMQLAVGLAILTAVAFRLHEPGRLAAFSSREAGLPTGMLAGALTTTVGINGPPMVIWLRARRATVTELRDTLAVVFLALNLAAIPSVARHGGAIPAAVLPALAAALLLGHVLGLRAHARLPARTLDRGLVAILAVAGAASIVAGSISLL
jgi:uncharacterized membrane protein YfcA